MRSFFVWLHMFNMRTSPIWNGALFGGILSAIMGLVLWLIFQITMPWLGAVGIGGAFVLGWTLCAQDTTYESEGADLLWVLSAIVTAAVSLAIIVWLLL